MANYEEMATLQRENTLKQLRAQAGPRGATYVGRVVEPGSTETSTEILSRLPVESPDAEGLGTAALAAGGMLALPKPKPFMNLGQPGKAIGYAGEKYGHTQKVRVSLPGGETFVDEIKGMNKGHALARARSNWEGAGIVPID